MALRNIFFNSPISSRVAIFPSLTAVCNTRSTSFSLSMSSIKRWSNVPRRWAAARFAKKSASSFTMGFRDRGAPSLSFARTSSFKAAINKRAFCDWRNFVSFLQSVNSIFSVTALILNGFFTFSSAALPCSVDTQSPSFASSFFVACDGATHSAQEGWEISRSIFVSSSSNLTLSTDLFRNSSFIVVSKAGTMLFAFPFGTQITKFWRARVKATYSKLRFSICWSRLSSSYSSL